MFVWPEILGAMAVVAASAVACGIFRGWDAPRPHAAPGRRRPRQAGHGRGRVPWLLALIVASASALAPRAAAAQAVRYGVVMEPVRDTLHSLWSDAPDQLERAYCISNWSYGVYHAAREEPAQDDTIFRVFTVREAPVRSAGPSSVDFECPPGQPEMHTHTPTTCRGDDLRTCVSGGLNAFSCQPSRQDLQKLAQRGDAFAVIQCDARAFRFYFASELLPQGTVAAAARTRGATNGRGLPGQAQRGSVVVVPAPR
ncbi:MAG TPA: hypothetical protein VNA89_16035 [Gemmatimonadaceae bacterium]|nr:hypothetical protein [Gemmatimonadaceae bacterium]